jgi:ABC-type dipeptide/oligopeptide/nickel transport system permease subunit
VLERLWKQRSLMGLIGLGILLGLFLMALLAPQISPYDPFARVDRPFLKPSASHWLGTNDIGQDIASELIYGTRISLLIGLLAALVAVSIGTLVGLLAGYCGGTVDTVLMRLVDVVLVIPFLPLMILLAAYLGPSFWNIIIVIGVLVWARPARVIRSQALSLRSRGYVVAAESMGGKLGHVLFTHVLPGVMPLALAQFVMAASHSILIEASLGFLGLGDPLRKSWGSILHYAQMRGAFLSGAWLWWVTPPGLMITFASLGFTLVGYALEELYNPRLRKER